MAATEEPEVQFAQRLACNERSVRTKALRKLRKYIGVRSHGTTGGFTDVELLKLWKGLFYCLWMQDKPLMQEELSRNVSTLIHSFHRFDTQLLYFVSFLQTVKREWTGIDRLRMDKFFQLVRFMFRQTFERLKRNGWDGGEVGRFVEVLKAELLQGSGGAPSGLQLHVLDLYLTELAAVGAVELTAAQNLTFIEPFCKTAAKTKDRTLFGAVCSGVFSVIIDQAPFAIQDLMKELEAAESDSGQASEEEEEEEEEEETPAGKNKKHKASKSKEEGEDDEDELLDLDDPDGELQDDIGPVLQFDYSAVADKLLELSSRSGTPGPNRQRLYRIVKVLRDLSEGVFPQAECPEEVSTDEDDDMFATRKKLKGMKRRGLIDADLGDSPAAKKMKKKKKEEEEEDGEPANEKRKKKKKKKKRKKRAGVDNGEMENGCGESECSVKESPEGAAVAVEVSEDPPPAEPTVQSQEEVDGGDEGDGGDVSPDKGSPATKKRRKRKKKKKAAAAALTGEEEPASEAAAPPQAETGSGAEKTDGEAPAAGSPETLVKTPAKKKNKKKKEPETKRTTDSEQEVAPLGAGDATPAPEKEEEEGLRAELQPQAGAQVNGVSSDTLKKKKSKRKGLKLPQRTAAAGEGEEETPGEAEGVEEPQEVTKAAKRKKRKIPVVFEFEADELEEVPPGQQQTPPTGQKKKKKKKVSGAPKSDFVSFQSRAAVPTPLFCRTRKSGPNEKTLRTGKSPAPDSGSKKVTFGLKNNKTAEFKKTDRSLLLSPDGSSRVPFDPAQKPKCGVLKSPPVTRLAAARRASLAAANSAAKPRRRPAAADFF